MDASRDDSTWRQRAVRIHDPILSCEVDLLGVAHVSATSAIDAELSVKGDAHDPPADGVVLELDEQRLHALLERDRWKSYEARRAPTALEVLDRIARAGARNHLTMLVHQAARAILGAEPGGEFHAAYEAAREVGAMVVLGDRPGTITIQRLAARGRSFGDRRTDGSSMNHTLEPDRWDDRFNPGERRKQNAEDQLIRAAERAGCKNARGAMEAMQRMFKKGNVEPIATSDLHELRKCAVSAVEHMRKEALFSEPNAQSNFRTTILEERNLILAKAIKDTCQKCGSLGKEVRVVAVVGASHVPGIQREWDRCDSLESRSRIREYNQSVPYDVVPAQSSYVLLGLGAFGAISLARRYPRFVVRGAGVLVGAMLTAGGVALYGLVELERQLYRVDNASKRLHEEEEMGFYHTDKI